MGQQSPWTSPSIAPPSHGNVSDLDSCTCALVAALLSKYMPRSGISGSSSKRGTKDEPELQGGHTAWEKASEQILGAFLLPFRRFGNSTAGIVSGTAPTFSFTTSPEWQSQPCTVMTPL